MNFLSFRILIRRIKSIKYLMRDKNVSKWKKGLIVLAIAYLCMPIDLIPIVIPNWTAVTADGSLAAHYENTVAVTEEGPQALTYVPKEV